MLTAQEAREIVRRADEHARGNTSLASMTIQTIRPNWTREMSVKAWSKGNDFAMILVTAPVKEKGIVFLKRAKEIWNWVPSIERNIKMPPSMMSQSWMGTDFTNDDLVKEASILDDYTHRITGEAVLGERSCHIIEMLPRSSSAVVWGKVMLWIDKKDDLMLRAEYFDEDDHLVNTMNSMDVKMLGGRLLPARVEMVPADKPGHKTVLIYTSVEFNQPLEDTFFTVQQMTRLK